MAIPTTGPINMTMLNNEFGLGRSLGAYRGCADGVPTSGPISMGHMRGKQNKRFRYWKIDMVPTIAGDCECPALHLFRAGYPMYGGYSWPNTIQVESNNFFGAYALFDNDSGTVMYTNRGVYGHVIVTFPAPVWFDNIGFMANASNTRYNFSTYELSGSNDKVNWVKLKGVTNIRYGTPQYNVLYDTF